jgi:hypothetical protein
MLFLPELDFLFGQLLLIVNGPGCKQQMGVPVAVGFLLALYAARPMNGYIHGYALFGS